LPVRNRRRAREAALAALYVAEFGKTPLEEALEGLEDYAALPPELRDFASHALHGVLENRVELDEAIQSKLDSYRVSRLAAVDRNVLRLGAWELLHCPDIPPKVTLDEAIELAKKYSTAESGRFVNGVLAAIMADSPKANWTPPTPGAELEPQAPPEPEPELEEIAADAPEVEELAKVGKWQIRSEEREA
jgi:transcription antitermination protein NusB